MGCDEVDSGRPLWQASKAVIADYLTLDPAPALWAVSCAAGALIALRMLDRHARRFVARRTRAAIERAVADDDAKSARDGT